MDCFGNVRKKIPFDDASDASATNTRGAAQSAKESTRL